MLSAAVCGSAVQAHPQKMTSITGPGIQLQTINHSFAGAIGRRIVTGFKKHGTFEAELTVVERDQKTTAVFKKTNEVPFGGSIILQGRNGLERHTVEFVELDRETDRFVFLFDGKPAEVQVLADGFEHGHFINPEYRLEYEGENVAFKLEDGQACYGYSLHLIAMIFPTYLF